MNPTLRLVALVLISLTIAVFTLGLDHPAPAWICFPAGWSAILVLVYLVGGCLGASLREEL